MCGIAGFVGVGASADLQAMTAHLLHRGPDAGNFYEDQAQRVFLGHRRLAILDLEGGAQPMSSQDGQIVVVFNGEIYNHHQLRQALQARGHRFVSDHSDTEVLVHGWREWGEDLPLHLNGMFAFAIFDQSKHRLFLARDRFGEKPLFYSHGDQTFAFASEVTSVLAHSHVPATIDSVAVQKYFAHSFFPAPHTLYKSVRKLPAGGRISLDLGSGTVRQDSFWRFAIEPAAASSDAQFKRWAEELRFLLRQAVERRLESDVRLGVFLSGGIDSSAILEAASHCLPAGEIDAFSIGFTEESYDETPFAKAMAEALGVRHHVDICDLGVAQDSIASLLGRLDEPIADSSILPTWMLCRFARRTVTVALSGDGGDELFAGYDPFKALAPALAARRLLPEPLLRQLYKMSAFLPRGDRNMSLDFKIRRGLRGIQHHPSLWNPVWLGAMGPDELAEHLNVAVDADELYAEVVSQWRNSNCEHIVDRTLEFYTNFYLPDDILTKTDRASMLESLEVRTPFLDNDLADFARRLPWQAKFRKGERKAILKQAMRGVLPDTILDRRKKGFGIPLQRWLRDFEQPAISLPDWNAQAFSQRWREHADRQADHRHLLWCWMALEHHLTARRAPSVS